MKMSVCQLMTMKAKGIYLWNSIKLLCWWHKFDDNPRKWIRDHPVWIGITFSIKSLCCISTWPTSWSYATMSLSQWTKKKKKNPHRTNILLRSIFSVSLITNFWQTHLKSKERISLPSPLSAHKCRWNDFLTYYMRTCPVTNTTALSMQDLVQKSLHSYLKEDKSI